MSIKWMAQRTFVMVLKSMHFVATTEQDDEDYVFFWFVCMK